MDVFEVRERLVADYREFTGSFVAIREPRVHTHVQQRTASDYQWPDPWLSLNPNFAPGASITELVSQGGLDPECERIFRIKPEPGDSDGPVLRLHRHQQDAVQVASHGHSYVLTTGTGSGRASASPSGDRQQPGRLVPRRPGPVWAEAAGARVSVQLRRTTPGPGGWPSPPTPGPEAVALTQQVSSIIST